MRVDRRGVLALILTGAASAAPAVSGCGLLTREPQPPHPLTDMLRDAQTMLARYEAVIDAHPSLADRLGPLRDDHRAHTDELTRRIGPAPTAPGRSASPTSVPARSEDALAELGRAEHGARHFAVEACLTAEPEHAGLLGSIAACRAAHREVLT